MGHDCDVRNASPMSDLYEVIGRIVDDIKTLHGESERVAAGMAAAGVAGAVCGVLRDLYETGTDTEVAVARRCWMAALEAAGLIPPDIDSDVESHGPG